MSPEPSALAVWPALQQAWRDRANYTLLISHFGPGIQFSQVLQAWRADRQRPQRLFVISAASETLPDPWPPPTANLHLLDYEVGLESEPLTGPQTEPTTDCLRLLLLQGTALPWRKLRQVQADMLWLDGRQTPHIQVYARLAAPGAQVRLINASPAQREDLRVAGFVAETTADWRYAPRHRMVSVPATASVAAKAALQGAATRHAIVIGAGIAGACTAAALARQGWSCTVLDAAPQPASGASGNAAAVFHGTVHGADGSHARYTRAGALHAQRVYAALLTRGVPGAVSGLVRACDADASLSQPSTLPPSWAQAWTALDLQNNNSQVQADSAWFFPGGGWVDAAATVHALLATPGVQFQGGVAAHALRRQGAHWQVLAADGSLLGSAPAVVLACAGSFVESSAGSSAGSSASSTQQKLDYSNALLASAGALPWPVTRARGQVTMLQHACADLPWPVTGGGYAVSLAAGHILCGASTADDDETPTIRASDQAYNLQRLQMLTGIMPCAGSELTGKVGWRERTPDRLPVLGAALDAAACTAAMSTNPGALPQLRQLPRVAGLYMLGALAGRGYTWGPLAGEVLASLICNTPVPLEGDLLDAIDPGRFWIRQAWRSAGSKKEASQRPAKAL